jgi:hypothetical protein
MSNFPFNTDKYKYFDGSNWNGSPLNFDEARSLADTILFWHTTNETSDFTQSGDGFDENVVSLAFGLVELLSDPNMIHRITNTGRQIEEDVNTLWKVDNEHFNILKEKIKKEFFGEKIK